MNRRRTVAWITLAVTCAACGETSGPAQPTLSGPGILELVFETPFSDDGAAHLTLAGPDITEMAPGGPRLTLFTEQQSEHTAILVAGDLTDGTVIVRFRVPDVADLAQYRAVVQEVAARGSYVQRERGPYSISVRPTS